MAVPFADLTDDHLRGADVVRVVDPADPGFTAWLPVRAGGWPRGHPAELVVEVEGGRRDGQLAEIRRRIAGLGPTWPAGRQAVPWTRTVGASPGSAAGGRAGGGVLARL